MKVNLNFRISDTVRPFQNNNFSHLYNVEIGIEITQ